MICQSSKVLVAADYSKIGRTAFSKIENLGAIDTLITNDKASEKYLDSIRAQGIEVITA